MHASSQGYGQQGTNSENSTGEPYEYSTAIDPTLEGGSGARMQDTKVTPDGRSRQGSQDQQGHRGTSAFLFTITTVSSIVEIS